MLSSNAGISGVSGDRFLGGNPIDSMYQRLIFSFSQSSKSQSFSSSSSMLVELHAFSQ